MFSRPHVCLRRYSPTRGALVVVACTLLGAPTAHGAPRATADRVDEVVGPQVHLVYATPADGVDHGLDTDGSLAGSFGSAQAWFEEHTGQRFRLDTIGGEPDIEFLRLSKSDAEIADALGFALDRIADEYKASRSMRPDKLYLFYYDGTSRHSCGSANYGEPESALYLHGQDARGGPPCDSNSFSSGEARYWEFSALHELVHNLGFVARCAPNHTSPTYPGHVSDSPLDLMWLGDQPWSPTTVDLGRDDYYEHTASGCPDLSESPYLTEKVGPPPPEPEPVRFTAPRDGATISGLLSEGRGNCRVEGPDTIARTENFVNGRLLDAQVNSPWACEWDTTEYANGWYTLGVVAYTAGGGLVGKDTIEVQVRNERPPEDPPTPDPRPRPDPTPELPPSSQDLPPVDTPGSPGQPGQPPGGEDPGPASPRKPDRRRTLTRASAAGLTRKALRRRYGRRPYRVSCRLRSGRTVAKCRVSFKRRHRRFRGTVTVLRRRSYDRIRIEVRPLTSRHG